MIEKAFDTELTPAQLELLALLSEECGEVIKAIGKIMRHGYNSSNPTVEDAITNREELERELGDVKAAVQLLSESGDISKVIIGYHKEQKLKNVKQWLHFQPE